MKRIIAVFLMITMLTGIIFVQQEPVEAKAADMVTYTALYEIIVGILFSMGLYDNDMSLNPTDNVIEYLEESSGTTAYSNLFALFGGAGFAFVDQSASIILDSIDTIRSALSDAETEVATDYETSTGETFDPDSSEIDIETLLAAFVAAGIIDADGNFVISQELRDDIATLVSEYVASSANAVENEPIVTYNHPFFNTYTDTNGSVDMSNYYSAGLDYTSQSWSKSELLDYLLNEDCYYKYNAYGEVLSFLDTYDEIDLANKSYVLLLAREYYSAKYNVYVSMYEFENDDVFIYNGTTVYKTDSNNIPEVINKVYNIEDYYLSTEYNSDISSLKTGASYTGSLNLTYYFAKCIGQLVSVNSYDHDFIILNQPGNDITFLNYSALSSFEYAVNGKNDSAVTINSSGVRTETAVPSDSVVSSDTSSDAAPIISDVSDITISMLAEQISNLTEALENVSAAQALNSIATNVDTNMEATDSNDVPSGFFDSVMSWFSSWNTWISSISSNITDIAGSMGNTIAENVSSALGEYMIDNVGSNYLEGINTSIDNIVEGIGEEGVTGAISEVNTSVQAIALALDQSVVTDEEVATLAAEFEATYDDPGGNLINLLYYLLIIVVLLIRIFLACLNLAIVLFAVPASTSMLPDSMIQGLEYIHALKIDPTITEAQLSMDNSTTPTSGIPLFTLLFGLIDIIILFQLIKALRREINTFDL